MPDKLQREESQIRARTVLDDVIKERDYQRKRWSTEHDVLHSHFEWVSIISTWLGKAASAALGSDTGTFRKRLVQIAAISIAAIEALDRDAQS